MDNVRRFRLSAITGVAIIVALVLAVFLFWTSRTPMAWTPESGVPFEESSPESQLGYLATFLAQPLAIEAGAATFDRECASCHGNRGEGFIGPNLTDQEWLHGESNLDIFRVISEGVLDAGMTPYGSTYSVEERAQLVAFIRSIEEVQ